MSSLGIPSQLNLGVFRLNHLVAEGIGDTLVGGIDKQSIDCMLCPFATTGSGGLYLIQFVSSTIKGISLAGKPFEDLLTNSASAGFTAR